MESVERLIAESEDALVAGVVERAGARGYGQRMPALDEIYRAEVAMLSANLVQTMAVEGEIRPLRAQFDPRLDAASVLGARLARGRSLQGRDASVLLGLLKCYRSTYLTVLDSAGFSDAEHRQGARDVSRFFDRVEAGVVAAASGDVRAEGRPGGGSGERDRYLSAFSRLPIPALFIDGRGRLEHINAAASALFGTPEAPDSRYFPDPSDRGASPVLAREIDEFRTSGDLEASFEREVPTSKGTRFFQVRLTKASPAQADSSPVLVVLNDLTFRRNAEEALRRSQNEYASLFEHMPIAFVHTRVLLDRRNRAADHTVLEVNPAFERLSGADAAGVVGRPFTEVLRSLGVSGTEWMSALGRTALTGETSSFEAQLGSGLWVSVTAFSPEPGHVALMAADITSAKAIEDSLARSRDSYLGLLDGLPSLVWRTGPDGRIDYVNEAWQTFTGMAPDQADPGWELAVHPADRDRRRIALEEAAAARCPVHVSYRLRSAAGDHRWVEERGGPFEGLDGAFAGLIGTTVDVHDQREREEALESMATTDALTGLLTGRVLEDALVRAVAQATRGSSSALLVLDVDGFGSLNERCGRDAGDACLRRLAALLQSLLRSGDVLGRIGADEFAVLLPSAGLEAGEGAAKRLMQSVRSDAEPDVEPFTVSVAVAEVTGAVEASKLLRSLAAAALEGASSGGDRIAVVDPRSGVVAIREGQGMASAVAAALASGGGLVMLYQPAFRVSDGSVEYCEALVRLRDAEGALIEPAAFLGDAARAGLMPRVTRWVLARAVEELAHNESAHISVNVGAEVLDDDALLGEVAASMRAADIAGHRLTFELPEDLVLRRMTDAQAFTDDARERGFGVALDHVGRSARSFTHLHSLALDRITIDGGVISALLGNPRQVRLVGSIQAAAGVMGIRTVAQWVEDDQTLAMVRDAGVEMAQGRHLGVPVETSVCGIARDWPSKFPKSRGGA